MELNDKLKSALLWAFILIVLASVFTNIGPSRVSQEKISYSDFLNRTQQGEVQSVKIADKVITGVLNNGKHFSTYIPIPDPGLIAQLDAKGVDVTGQPPEQQSILLHIFISWFPMIILIGVWLWFMRQFQGGAGGGKGGPMSFGRSRARLLVGDQIEVTFDDVAGIEEAKQEVQEFVDFLKDPAKFQKLGGKIPAGALLVGPPGTGKTLLAKAVAGEADVPFFTISGSDFVEMFVGVGASRVRDMFDQAKKQAPCIIFIDEIDAVGRHRGAGLGGGHDEREQTLNQLLVEMDGFEGKEGVIVMAATNRPDVLDPALLRPGRFDRQVWVSLPDIRGREYILKVHMQKVPMAKDVKASVIARGTPGFSGADLANLVNEAALFAARGNKRKVSMHEFEKAKDKIMMGAERTSMVMSDHEKENTAYHESGHAIVGLVLKAVSDHDPVYKVSIIPRGKALGVTMFLPEEDKYSMSLEAILNKLCSLYGGRIAEELIFGWNRVTTGASNDIEKASELARNLVTKWGLSNSLGPIHYGSNDQEVFLGKSVAKSSDMSGETAKAIDKEVKRIVDESYKKAKKILEDNMDKLHVMANVLMKYETIDETQIEQIMSGKPVSKPKDWDDRGDGDDDVPVEKPSKEVKKKPRSRKKKTIEESLGDSEAQA